MLLQYQINQSMELPGQLEIGSTAFALTCRPVPMFLEDFRPQRPRSNKSFSLQRVFFLPIGTGMRALQRIPMKLESQQEIILFLDTHLNVHVGMMSGETD